MNRNPIALGIVLVVGAVMAIGALVISLPAKTQGVDNLTHAFRPAFQPKSLTQTRKHMDTVKAMAAELDSKAIPALAAQLGTTPDQFRRNLAQGFPAVGAGMRQLPTILPYFDGVVGGLEAQAANFRLAVLVATGGVGLLAGRRLRASQPAVDGALLGPAAANR
ncbi:MAG: hypothetical protein ACRDYV_12435 [Acidimicrobiia bacterium]